MSDLNHGLARFYFPHGLVRPPDKQHAREIGELSACWRERGQSEFTLIGVRGPGEPAIVDRFLEVLTRALHEGRADQLNGKCRWVTEMRLLEVSQAARGERSRPALSTPVCAMAGLAPGYKPLALTLRPVRIQEVAA